MKSPTNVLGQKAVLAAAGLIALLAAVSPMSAAPVPLHVSGTKILNDKNEPVLLKGVNTASMEWSETGEGHILNTVSNAIHDWHVNIIRLPLSQDAWYGMGRDQVRGGRTNDGLPYRALVKQVVDYCSSNNCYVILDLHWSDCNLWGTNIGQHSMPDHNSITFWKDFAPLYANNPAVLYDLYNEPHDVPWDVWLKGGTITDKTNERTETPNYQYECVGMQELLNTVRATGAKNVVVAGGLDWAYDFSGILAGRQLSDPDGRGVIYANHCYNNKGDSVDKWLAKMDKATATLPVIISEFGGSTNPGRGRRAGPGAPPDPWLMRLIQAIDDHHWSYTAWDLHPSAGPTLISNWNYTPTPGFGVYVKQLIDGTFKYTPPAEPASNSPPPGAP